MKTSKVYLALFAFLLAFNVSLSAKLRQDPQPTPTTTEEPKVVDQTAEPVKPLADATPVSGEVLSTKAFGFGGSTTIKKLEFKLLDSNLCFSDLGVNSEGIIVAIGLDGLLYEYAFAEETFHVIKTDIEISNMWRIDINYDGIIYVITRCGDTYYLDCHRRWVKLPGCAIDIGAGRSGEIFKLGCGKPKDCHPVAHGILGEKKPSSRHVYKLICSCNCKCCDRRCKVFLKKYEYKTCELAEKRICYWIKLPNDTKGYDNKPVKFTRIDAKFTGFPIVTDGDRTIYEFIGGDENVFKKIYQAPSFFTDINDIASDNDGNDFFCTNIACYIVTGSSSETRIVDYQLKFKGASDVSVGPFGMISFISNVDKKMYTVAKVGFN